MIIKIGPVDEKLADFVLVVLVIPYNFAKCVWIFSFVTKVAIYFCSITSEVIQNLLICKSKQQRPCLQEAFDFNFLRDATSSIVNVFF